MADERQRQSREGGRHDDAAIGTPENLDPVGEGLVASGMELHDGVLVGAAGENVGDLVMGGRNCCTWHGDLKHFLTRSRRRVG